MVDGEDDDLIVNDDTKSRETLIQERDDAIGLKDAIAKELEEAKLQIMSLQQQIQGLQQHSSSNKKMKRTAAGVGRSPLAIAAAASAALTAAQATGAAAPSAAASTTTPIMPTPHKVTVVPKHALYGYYGKTHGVKIPPENYHVWDNGGKPTIDLKYTCLFVCPVTGEVFACGRYGECTSYQITSFHKANMNVIGTQIWYSKKASAEHGSASRAYDCWSYRDAYNNQIPTYPISGDETPYYTATDAPPLPLSSIPYEIQESIRRIQNKIQQENQLKQKQQQQGQQQH